MIINRLNDVDKTRDEIIKELLNTMQDCFKNITNLSAINSTVDLLELDLIELYKLIYNQFKGNVNITVKKGQIKGFIEKITTHEKNILKKHNYIEN